VDGVSTHTASCVDEFPKDAGALLDVDDRRPRNRSGDTAPDSEADWYVPDFHPRSRKETMAGSLFGTKIEPSQFIL